MDLSIPGSTTNSPLSTPSVFGDNVQDLLGTGALNVNPSAIITVNSTADVVDDSNSGVTTLRDAINQANADNGQDLIVFDRSLFSNQQTITLSGTELDITHNLDIIAPRDPLTGGDLVTVSGNKASRVFEIEKDAMVNLSGLIVADGSVTGDNGGGIKNSGTLTLDSSIVRNDSATVSTGTTFPGGNGGGISNNIVANLTISNSTISNNSATGNGGGIESGQVPLELDNSTITNNSAKSFKAFSSNGGGIDGGGIISNSTISNNSATGSGGGINSTEGNLELDNSTITNNSAKNFNGFRSNGGGINMIRSIISNSTISNNSTTGNGGGIYGTSTISNSTISNNSAVQDGGGIYNPYSGTIQLSNSTVNNNTASNNGGGIYNYTFERFAGINYLGSEDFIVSQGIVNATNSTLSGNTAGNTGGGIYNIGAVTLLFSTLTLNQAANGGGVFNGSFTGTHTGTTPGSVNARNTIIATNLNSANGVNPDVSGNFISNGYNLIGDSTGSAGFDATGDIVGTSDNPIDPRLAPLDFYGGSTQTIALLPDSPAIGAGDPTVLDTDPTTDQRGLPRRAADGSTDIGAFQFSS